MVTRSQGARVRVLGKMEWPSGLTFPPTSTSSKFPALGNRIALHPVTHASNLQPFLKPLVFMPHNHLIARSYWFYSLNISESLFSLPSFSPPSPATVISCLHYCSFLRWSPCSDSPLLHVILLVKRQNESFLINSYIHMRQGGLHCQFFLCFGFAFYALHSLCLATFWVEGSKDMKDPLLALCINQGEEERNGQWKPDY